MDQPRAHAESKTSRVIWQETPKVLKAESEVMHEEEDRCRRHCGEHRHLQHAFKTMLTDAHLHEGHWVVPMLLQHYFHITKHQTYELSLPSSGSQGGLVEKPTNIPTKSLKPKGSLRRLIRSHRDSSRSSCGWRTVDHLVCGENGDVLEMSPMELRKHATYASDRLLAASPFVCKVLDGAPLRDRFKFDPLTSLSANQTSMLCDFEEDKFEQVGLDDPFRSCFDDGSDEEAGHQRKRTPSSYLRVRSILIWVAIR